MRCSLVVLATLAAGAGEVSAREPEFGADLVLFSSLYDVRGDSPYNPDNLLAGIPRMEHGAQARLRWRLEGKYGVLAIGPRVTYSRATGTNAASGDKRDTKAYLQSWLVEGRLGNVDLFYSRELMLWGPSQFASPSNPFFTETNQVNPFTELPSRDFAGARWRIDDRNTVALVRNVDEGRDRELLRPFKPETALRADHVGDAFAVGAVASYRAGRKQYGAYGQWTVNDAVLVYFDAATFRGSRRLLALAPGVASNGTQDWQLATRADDRKRHFDVLVGASYTFEGGSTVNLEYRRNTEGYTAAERAALDAFAVAQAGRFRRSDPFSDPFTAGAAAGQLGAVVQPYARTFGRDTVYAQYVNRRIAPSTSLVAQLSYGLGSKDGSTTIVISHDLNDRIKLAANLTVPFGSRHGDTRRYLDSVLFLGMTASF
ncbi:hypothetical protein OU994_03985 [Pseudoduganella sp. SL102]|uniref:hypothetical protein n=1 Tax=Pseudoduganella sp. SL102 TaxID=2995154 RepID=UPI00248B5D3A|nr:hypothetical protein [Pseudoduganella sp. SL102]WBS03476.1 hypothetical protein OU994_03985 [Pseudoduganella sp. SL102]